MPPGVKPHDHQVHVDYRADVGQQIQQGKEEAVQLQTAQPVSKALSLQQEMEKLHPCEDESQKTDNEDFSKDTQQGDLA
jgi:hypothetical protein